MSNITIGPLRLQLIAVKVHGIGAGRDICTCEMRRLTSTVIVHTDGVRSSTRSLPAASEPMLAVLFGYCFEAERMPFSSGASSAHCDVRRRNARGCICEDCASCSSNSAVGLSWPQQLVA